MAKLSRRQLLKSATVATAMSAIPMPLWAASAQPLVIPKLIETRRGKPIFLNLQTTQTALLDNKLTEVWGFNGQYLGPTIRIKRNDFAKLNYRNNLSQFVALNIQGLQASGELMGGIAKTLQKNDTWAPIIPVTQAASTCFYRSCTLANSAYQTYRGLVGMWLIEDADSQQAGLPNKYGVNDIPLILQDLQLNSDGVPMFQQGEAFIGEYLLVNGQQAPYLEVPRGIVRLRLLNASLSRSYELRFDDERNFVLIAQDLGFLPQGKVLNAVHLAPGERIEILVDLNEGDGVSLIVGKKRGLFDKIGRLFKSDGELNDNTVLELRPQGAAASSAFDNKKKWQFVSDAAEILNAPVQAERQFHLDRGNATINEQRFDPRRIDVTSKVGNIERWTLTASSGVGFTVQGAKFVIESYNGNKLPASDIGWKDTAWISGKVQILVKFDNPSSNNYPFTFGASDLMLADKGCMGLMLVQ